MMTTLRFAALIAVSLTLAGCQKERGPTDAKVAGGEVLPGSASDAMLPLDTVRSQAPLAPKSESSGTPEKAGKPAGQGAPRGAPVPEAAPVESAPAPAATTPTPG